MGSAWGQVGSESARKRNPATRRRHSSGRSSDPPCARLGHDHLPADAVVRGDPDAMMETRLRDLAAREREHARPFVDLPAGDGVVEDAESDSERLGIDPAG